MGLVDKVSRRLHKKPAVVQMNHPVIEAPAFPERRCECAPGDHQPVEGSVQVLDEASGHGRTAKRSALASEWTTPFCEWLLSGLQHALDETALPAEDYFQPRHQLHRRNPPNKFFENVEVEVEPTRGHLSLL